jgi:2-dehydro-3-deoxyglucarate aldolase/4-hydroxy-2-oxoheptanedioate aldolase
MEMENINDFRNLDYAPGTFLSMGSTVVTEVAAQYPFKWLLLDMEHGEYQQGDLIDHLRAVARTGIMAIVRVPAADAVLIGRVLDAGADGIMLPHVISPEQAQACIKMMRYLPEGTRGFSSSVRQFAYGTAVPKDIGAIHRPLFFAQIEDVEGVVRANEIAAIDGVDTLFVGPADLRLAIKHYPPPGIDHDRALLLVADAARLNKKKAGILVRDYQLIAGLRQAGYSHIAIGSDLALLRAGYDALKDLLTDCS